MFEVNQWMDVCDELWSGVRKLKSVISSLERGISVTEVSMAGISHVNSSGNTTSASEHLCLLFLCNIGNNMPFIEPFWTHLMCYLFWVTCNFWSI